MQETITFQQKFREILYNNIVSILFSGYLALPFGLPARILAISAPCVLSWRSLLIVINK
jgi:hypothetical protein